MRKKYIIGKHVAKSIMKQQSGKMKFRASVCCMSCLDLGVILGATGHRAFYEVSACPSCSAGEVMAERLEDQHRLSIQNDSSRWELS